MNKTPRTECIRTMVTTGQKRYLRLQAASIDKMTVSEYISRLVEKDYREFNRQRHRVIDD